MNVTDYCNPVTSAWVVESLAHVLWQGTLAAGLAAVAAFALRNRSAQARYGVYSTAMLLTAACLPLNLCLLAPKTQNESNVVGSVALMDSGGPAPAAESFDWVASEGDAAHAPVSASPPNLHPTTEVTEPHQTAGRHALSWQWASPWIVVAYVTGIAVMAIRLLMSLYGCQRLRSTAEPIHDAQLQQLLARLGEQLRLRVLPVVAYSARVTTPLVVGVVKPAILLPVAILSDLSTEQVESLLLHELAHIRRYDHWVNLVQRVIEAVLFFHPAVWWLSHKVSVEREHCCDDLAIGWGSEPCDYAESLVRMSEARYRSRGLSVSSAASLAATGGRRSRLSDRVLRVLGMPHAGPSVGLTRVGIAALVAVTLTSAALLAALPETPQEEAKLQAKADLAHNQQLVKSLKQQCTTVREGFGMHNGERYLKSLELWGATGGALRTLSAVRGLEELTFVASDLRTPAFAEVGKLKSLNRLATINGKLLPEQLHDLGDLSELEHLDLQFTIFELSGQARSEMLGELSEAEQQTQERLLSAGKGDHIIQSALLTDRAIPSVRKLTKLKSLRLVNTLFTATGLQHIGTLTNLEIADIGPIEMSAESVETLSKLKELRSLEYFNADDPTVEGLVALEKLVTLDIWAGEVTDVGAANLAKLTQLRRLEIRGNQVTDKGLMLLAQLPDLELLDIQYAKQISEKGVQQFRQARPACELKSDVEARRADSEAGNNSKAPAKISGKIVLEDGSPADAKGWLYYDSSVNTGGNSTTSAGGTVDQFTDSFRCEVPAGTVQLAYFADGYAPTWVGPFELKPGQQLDNMTITLRPGFSASLVLQDDEGQPVPGATVVATPNGEHVFASPVRELQTDDNGQLLLEHLASDDDANHAFYTFTITAPGYQPLRTEPLRVEQGETVRPTMVRSVPATGVIRFADGTPAPNTKLRVIREWRKDGKGAAFGNEGEGFWGTTLATTDSRGRFRLDQLSDGSQYLFVIEAVDGVRAIVDHLKADMADVQVVLPPRKDLVVYVKGDLSQLNLGRKKPFVSIRQPVKALRPDGSTFGELLGADATIEPVEGGGRVIFRGLAVDLREDAPQQTVRVSLGYDRQTQQTVDINPDSGTLVQFAIPNDTKEDTQTTAEEGHRLQILPARTLTKTNDISTARALLPGRFVEWSSDGESTEWLLLDEDQTPLFTEQDVESAQIKPAPDGQNWQSIAITLTEAGGKRMESRTSELLEGGAEPNVRLVALLDGEVLLAPRLMSTIGRKCELTGIRSREQIQVLSEVLNLQEENGKERDEAHKTWGAAVDGVQARLVPKKLTWPEGTPPEFEIEILNRGNKALTLPHIDQQLSVEVDGNWHSYGAISVIAGFTGFEVSSKDVKPFNLLNRPLLLDENWGREWVRKKESSEKIEISNADFVAKHSVLSALTPGKHSIRVKIIGELVTQPVEIEVVAAEERSEASRLVSRDYQNILGDWEVVSVAGSGGKLMSLSGDSKLGDVLTISHVRAPGPDYQGPGKLYAISPYVTKWLSEEIRKNWSRNDSLHLHPRATPARLTYKPIQGDQGHFADQEHPPQFAIYRLEGDTLTIVAGDPQDYKLNEGSETTTTSAGTPAHWEWKFVVPNYPRSFAKIDDDRQLLVKLRKKSPAKASDGPQDNVEEGDISEIRKVLQQLATSGREKNYRQLVDLLTDEQAAVLAGLTMQSAFLLQVVEQMGGQTADGQALQPSKAAIDALMKKSLRATPSPESEAALAKLTEFTLQGFIGAKIDAENSAQQTTMTPEVFMQLLRRSSGVLADPRAFTVEAWDIHDQLGAKTTATPIALNADAWKLAVRGDRATATVPEDAPAGIDRQTLELQRINGRWRISNMFSALAWPGVVADQKAQATEIDSEDDGAASADSGQAFEGRREANLHEALVDHLEMDGKPLAHLAEAKNTKAPTESTTHPFVAKLQGEWQAEMRSVDGINKMIAHVEDNQIRFCELNGENPTTFDFTIVSGTPHQKIDMKPKLSALQRQEILAEIEFNPELAPLVLASDGFPGIIQAKNDGFSICLPDVPEGERPMLFGVNKSQGLWVLKRPADTKPKEDGDSVADQSQPPNSLTVRLRDKDGQPIPNVRLRVYDGSAWGGYRKQKYKMESAVSDASGRVSFPGLFERIPEKAGYWIAVSNKEGAKWSAPRRPLVGYGDVLTKLHDRNPLVHTEKKAGGLEISVTLREECPLDVEIVDSTTGKRKHWGQLLFKDNRVEDWTVAAFTDYVGDPGGDDPSRLGLVFFTTVVSEMSEARFMATREGYYPVEFDLTEKLSPDKTLRLRVELKPAPPIELTILDADGAPAVGAKLEYIGPDVRGSMWPLKPSDESGRITLPYPELGKFARWRIEHASQQVEIDANWLLEQEATAGGPIRAEVRLQK